MDVPQLPPKARGFRRFWPLYLILSVLLIAYVSSYFYISRMRWQEAKKFNAPCFLYVSAERAINAPEDSWRPEHLRLLYFYAPINFIDRELFDGPYPMSCFLSIGQKKK